MGRPFKNKVDTARPFAFAHLVACLEVYLLVGELGAVFLVLLPRAKVFCVNQGQG